MDKQKLLRATAEEYLRRKWYGVPAAHWDAYGLWWPPEPAINPCCLPLRASRNLRRHCKSARHLTHLVDRLGSVTPAEVLREARYLATEVDLRRLGREIDYVLQESSLDLLEEGTEGA